MTRPIARARLARTCLPCPFAPLLLLAMLACPPAAWSQMPMERPLAIAALKHTDYGLRYLRSRQGEDGSWSDSVYTTARALLAFLQSYRDYQEDDGAFITRPLAYLLDRTNGDGSIGDDAGHRVRDTAAALLALKATGNPRYETVIQGAEAFLAAMQADESRGFDAAHPAYGAITDEDGRPTLATHAMALEALGAAGPAPDSPLRRRARAFLHRLQAMDDGGGFAPTPAAPGAPPGATAPATHAGLAALLDAGAARDDPRVAAAWTWIGANYRVGDDLEPPGPTGPLYFHDAVAAGMVAYGAPTVSTGDGVRNWRNDLVTALLEAHNEDGSWGGAPADRDLATANAVVALNRVVRSLR